VPAATEAKPPRVLVYYRTDARPALTPEEINELETFFGPPTFLRVATVVDEQNRHGQQEVVDYAMAGAIDAVVTRRGIDLSPDGFKGWFEVAQRFHDAGLSIWVWKERYLNIDRASKKFYPALQTLHAMNAEYTRWEMRSRLRKAEANGKHVGRKPLCDNCGHPSTSKGKPVHAGGTGKCSMCGSCSKYVYRGMRQPPSEPKAPPVQEPEEEDGPEDSRTGSSDEDGVDGPQDSTTDSGPV
jgi:hypothetical protein